MSRNKLQGTIPSEFVQLASRKGRAVRFVFDRNKLKGRVPAALSNLKNLRTFVLQKNALTGSFPTEFGRLSALEILDFSRNHFSGTIASEIGNLHVLLFWFVDNRIHGSIPSEMGRMMAGLGFADNNLEGSLPSGFLGGDVVKVFHGNRLSGKLHEQGIGKVAVLTLHENRLRGSVPAMTFDDDLEVTLTLHGNRLSCGLPEPKMGGFHQENGGIQRSSTLLGNSFIGPLPAWIPKGEQDPILYQMPWWTYRNFLVSVAIGSVGFSTSLLRIFGIAGIRSSLRESAAPCWYSRWIFRTMLRSMLLSVCVIWPAYVVGAQWYECPVFPEDLGDLSHAAMEWFVGSCLLVHFLLACTSFKQHMLASQWANKRKPLNPSSSTSRLLFRVLAWLGWAIVVLLLSSPSTFFVLAKSLPKESTLTSIFGDSLILYVYHVSAIIGSLVQAYCLPRFGSAYASRCGFNHIWLEYWSKTACQWILPSTILLIMHENCLGLWRVMWSVCNPYAHFQYGRFNLDFPTVQGSPPLLSTEDVCQIPSPSEVVRRAQCGRSIVGVMGPLLVQKCLSEAFILPSIKLWRWYAYWRISQNASQSNSWILPVFHRVLRSQPKPTRLIFHVSKMLEFSLIWGPMIPALQPLLLLSFVTNAVAYHAGVARFDTTTTIDDRNAWADECLGILTRVLTYGFFVVCSLSSQVSWKCLVMLGPVPFLVVYILSERSGQAIGDHSNILQQKEDRCSQPGIELPRLTRDVRSGLWTPDS